MTFKDFIGTLAYVVGIALFAAVLFPVLAFIFIRTLEFLLKL